MRRALLVALGLATLALLCLTAVGGGAAAGEGAAPAIVAGTPTGYRRWEGVVNLYNQGPGCTGVLIDPEVVLASGHCTPGFITNPTQVLIAGGADLRDPAQVIAYAQVAEVATAPGFDGGDWMSDVALLRLDRAVADVPYYAIHRAVRPAKGSIEMVVGYGATGKGLTDHGVHREGEVTITDPFLGDPEFNRRLIIFTGPAMVCHGDSGAPVFAPVDGEWQVLAVSARTDSCETDGLGFAVYLAPIQDWLGEVCQRWTGRPLPDHGGLLPGPTPTPTPTPVTPSATPTPPATSSPTAPPSATPSPTATAPPTPPPLWLPRVVRGEG